MFRSLIFTAVVVSACSSPTPANLSGQIPADAPHQPVDLDGDGQSDGQQYDLDGDGHFDAVDLDGDGLLDGGDFDGDGEITVFSQLGSGLVEMSESELALLGEDTDPDFEVVLDGEKADGPMQGVTTRSAVDLTAYLPKPVQQGRLSSCTAFAAASIATGIRAAREGVTPDGVWASPAFLYARSLEVVGMPCNSNTNLIHALATLVIEGATPNSRLPYSDQMCAMMPAAEEAQPYRVGTFTAFLPFSRDKAKEHLSAGQPIMLATRLPGNFMRWGGSRDAVFKGESGQLGGPHGGGHAMVIVGYDDAKSAYRVLNSWGTDWGDGGYVWWDYADLEMYAQAGMAVSGYREAPPSFQAVDEPGLMVSAGPALIARGGSGDRLIVRLGSNAPLRIQKVSVDGQAPDDRFQFLGYGNVTAKSATPLAAGQHTLVISGNILGSLKEALSDGAAFTRTLTVTVGDPVSDPDGKL